MRRLLAIIGKEFLHIFRDPRSLVILIVMPLVMIFLFGYAVRLDIKHISLAVWDRDGSAVSRDLIRSFQTSGYFELVRTETGSLDPHRVFRRREALTVLSIPENYGRSIETGHPDPVQFLADASDSNTATIAGQYAEQIVFEFVMKHLNPPRLILDIGMLIYFNPELESTFFIVPGLIAVLFMMVCALLTSVTIAREKETGTLEQILVSPVRTREIVIGKVLPYVILAGTIAVMVIALSMVWFDVPFRGDPWLLVLYSLIYLLCSLALGILISTKARTMQVAMMVALVITMLPSVMLSGFMFPITSMPAPIRAITYIVPARYYLIIIRGIMLKGIGWLCLKKQVLLLLGFTLFLLAVSIRRFKASLE
ncbi:ABC transporter permease [bacterium]|nr:ABC transporter permease [candidate division CSSED10-310 bacterium]